MGSVTSRGETSVSSNERALLKQAWAGIESNPQFHGNLFFLSFCEAYPQYSKYFTMDPEMPLTIDANISSHFAIIMGTMGFLITDSYERPKDFNYFVEYIAMIHKDMNLVRSDLYNFAVSLIEYLNGIFPLTITNGCRKLISKYIFHLVNKISDNIEKFRKHEPIDVFQSREANSKFVKCLVCQDYSLYGQSVDYWTERKLIWEERLEEWKNQKYPTITPIKSSSLTNNNAISSKKETQDRYFMEDSETSLDISNRSDISRTNKELLSFDNVEMVSPSPRRVILKTKKFGQKTYDVVEVIPPRNASWTNLEFLKNRNRLVMNNHDVEKSIASLNIDSIARRRRRRQIQTIQTK